MDQLPALAVVVPLLAAAAISALKPALRSRRRVLDGAAIATSAAVTVMLLVLLSRTAQGDVVYWFAGFWPSPTWWSRRP